MTDPQPPSVRRVIVADDHEWIRQILVQVVTQTLPSAEIIVTDNGSSALEAYQHGRADFVITSHQLPGMDGMTLTRRLREQAPALPILMLSAQAEIENEALAAGASWFVSKQEVLERLPTLLRGHFGASHDASG